MANNYIRNLAGALKPMNFTLPKPTLSTLIPSRMMDIAGLQAQNNVNSVLGRMEGSGFGREGGLLGGGAQIRRSVGYAAGVPALSAPRMSMSPAAINRATGFIPSPVLSDPVAQRRALWGYGGRGVDLGKGNFKPPTFALPTASELGQTAQDMWSNITSPNLPTSVSRGTRKRVRAR